MATKNQNYFGIGTVTFGGGIKPVAGDEMFGVG